MGEKFAANPVTGTGSMSVPIATSPGRSGFGPQLSLSYDSGSGNGPFGLGGVFRCPRSRARRIKGFANTKDAEQADVFILSGAENLLPLLARKNGTWERDEQNLWTINDELHVIQRYRPRIEGLFARIERSSSEAQPDEFLSEKILWPNHRV